MTRRTVILVVAAALVLATALVVAVAVVAGCTSTTTVNSPLDVGVNNSPATVVVTSK